jgi:exosortase A
MPRELALTRRPLAPWLPGAWRLPLLRLGLAWIGLIALVFGEWRAMAHQWWDASSYNHILLVPPILFGLVRLRAAKLGRLAPVGYWPGLLPFVAALMVWLPASLADVDLLSQLAAVAMLQAAALALLGPRVAAALLFPLAYMTFLVPFGDELVPTLQMVTAKMAVALTHWSGVPARIDGVFIDTPAGLFRVAEAWSGVKFLIAMVALGALVANVCFKSWRRRALFMAAAVIVPVLANGVRAWGTIYIAQSMGIAFAAGFDHIVYGWVFFALVIAAQLGVSWRFYDRPASEPFVDVEALDRSSWLSTLVRFSAEGGRVLFVLIVLAVSALAMRGAAEGWMDRLAAVP